MKYTVYEEVFEIAPNLEFGIIIGRGVNITESNEADREVFIKAQRNLEKQVSPDDIRLLPNVAQYREVLQNAAINPNKFTASVEAMFKRVAKGKSLPFINTLVDLVNAISIRHGISMGGHDLKDIHYDLEVRFSKPGDRFLPFGETDWEMVDSGELIFTAGQEVQTRKWVWRQSELGKITLNTKDVFFQLAGFANDSSLKQAMEEVEDLVTNRLGGTAEVFIINSMQPSLEFQR